MGYLSDQYRPEHHYMRGPGPKWFEKHVGQSGVNTIEGEGGRKNPTLLRAIELRLRRWLPTRWRNSRGAAYEPRWNSTDRLGPWSV
jgi:hypothetical protein